MHNPDEDNRFSLLDIDDEPAIPGYTPKAAPVSPIADAPFQHKAGTRPVPGLPAPATTLMMALQPPIGFSRLTSAGVEMSPRMFRFYGALAARKIPIHSFSTDVTVAAHLPALRQLVAELEAVEPSTATAIETERRELIEGLYGLMNRTPQNRSQSQTPQGTTPGTTPTNQDNRHGLLAVGKADEATGAVVYWRLLGSVADASLKTAWASNKLDEKHRPTPPSDGAALTRAVRDQVTQQLLARKHPQGGWSLVREDRSGGRLRYGVGPRFTLDAGNVAVGYSEEPKPEHRARLDSAVAEYGSKVREAYKAARDSVGAEDVGTWLCVTMRRLHAVCLRDTGGVYFVPAESVTELHAIKAALRDAGASHRVFEIPAMKGDDTVSAIVDALATESAAIIAALTGELNGEEIGTRRAGNAVGECETAIEKLRRYSSLLGAAFVEPVAALQKLRAAFAERTSRVSGLDVR